VTQAADRHIRTGISSRVSSGPLVAILIAPLMFGFIGLAYAGVANFLVTNDSDDTWFMKCSGPYLRVQGVEVQPGDSDKLFYSPGDPIFFTGPYGKWSCGIAPRSICDNPNCFSVLGCSCCQGAWGSGGVRLGQYDCSSVVEFCLEKDPDPDIQFTVTADGKLISNGRGVPCNKTLVTAATLGFEASSKIKDQDLYEFDGTAGDAVMIVLEIDSSVGGNGQQATLVVEDIDEGFDLRENTTGTLPLTLQVTIPKDDVYRVKVTNRTVDTEDAFAGGYLLHLDSANDLIDEIRPHDPRIYLYKDD